MKSTKTPNFVFVLLLSIVLLVFLAILLSFVVSGMGLFDGDYTRFSFATSIAVIPIKGDIVSEADVFFGSEFSATDLVEMIKEAEADPDVGAIFLDIDSGGGSVVATKQIVYALRETEKPTVSYIGDIGASGAYYVAAATDYIVADEDSLTGSIGVISMFPEIVDLMDEWGIKMHIIKGGKNKSIANPFEELTEEQEQLLQIIIGETFEQFKSDILEFRGEYISPIQFEAVADGRLLSGRQALKLGLIDETSSKDAAIQKAAELAGIEGEPYLKSYIYTEFTIFDLFVHSGKALGIGFRQGLSEGLSYNQPKIEAK